MVDHTKFDTVAKIAAAPVMVPLRSRRLERAVLIDANLPRADFTGANLEGVSFMRARLQGAWFDHTTLSGGRLDDVHSQGASFYQARLQGVSLAGAQLQGAWLADAQLQGASLAGVDLRRAWLKGSDLRGAILHQARLQGVSFAGVKLHGASLSEAFVWRADLRDAEIGEPGLRIERNVTDPQAPPCEGPPKDACDPADTLDSFRRIVGRYMPEGLARDRMLVRLGPSLDPGQPLDGQEEVENGWTKLAGSPWAHRTGETDPADRQGLADLWREIARAVDGAPFVLTTLVATLGDPHAFTLARASAPMSKLAAEFLADECAAKPALTAATRMQLVELKTRPPSRAGESVTKAAGR